MSPVLDRRGDEEAATGKKSEPDVPFFGASGEQTNHGFSAGLRRRALQ